MTPNNELPDGRYFDGAYEWIKEDGEWTPLLAPQGMPSEPFKIVGRVLTTYVPVDFASTTHEAREVLSDAVHSGWVDEPDTPPGHKVEKVWDEDKAIDAIFAAGFRLYPAVSAKDVSALVDQFADWRAEYGEPVADEVLGMRSVARMLLGEVSSLPSRRWEEARVAALALIARQAKESSS